MKETFDLTNNDVVKKLNALTNGIGEYKESLSRFLTMGTNGDRTVVEYNKAFNIAEKLGKEVYEMVHTTRAELAEKTKSSYADISRTKSMLYILVVMAPFFTVGLGFIFVKQLTKAVKALLHATRELKGGDLDHRIEGLGDEFGEVAASFNEMSDSLKDHMRIIRESEKRYRTLFESAGDAIFIVAAEGEEPGKIVDANPAAAEMHGYIFDELLELNLIIDLNALNSASDGPERIERILNGEWIHAEITHSRKDGTVFPVEISAGLLEYMDHKYILAVVRDISERKRVEQTLQRAEQMKMAGEWATGLVHEIKNPLAGIKGSVELVAGEPNIAEEDRAIIFQAVDEIKKIESLLKSLLKFAKPPKPQLALTDINDIFDKTIAFALRHPSLLSDTSSGISVFKDLNPKLPKTMADPMQIQQIFLNLLLNAIEAMPDGGVLATKTSYGANLDTIQIMITDTGYGIKKSTMSKVFRPFFTTKSKGTGLGLAIAMRVAKEHGGNIWVESYPSKGTSVTLELPISI